MADPGDCSRADLRGAGERLRERDDSLPEDELLLLPLLLDREEFPEEELLPLLLLLLLELPLDRDGDPMAAVPSKTTNQWCQLVQTQQV